MALDKDFIEQIKKELEEKEKQLKEELSDFTVKSGRGVDEYDADFPQYGDKSGENATEVAAYNNDVSLKRVLESDLKDIRDTLKRIANGTFGVCKYCKQPINPQRLKARPTSSSCINCKKKFSGEV